jgi:hypothetical protein
VYQLTGDSIGALPFEQPGYIKIKNFGLPNTWVSLQDATGSLMNNQTGTVLVNINAAGLVPGTYQCNLVARDLYNNKFVVPVTLHVTFPVDAGGSKLPGGTGLRGNFPNPFSGETQIRYDLSATGDVTIDIYSLQGLKIRTLKQDAVPAGSHALTWDGKDEEGHQAPAGVYTCRMKTGGFTGSRKMILIR